MHPSRRPVRPVAKRLDTAPAQSSVRSHTHGIPSWEHPRMAKSKAALKRPTPYPYRPPTVVARTQRVPVTGSSTDHHAMLQMDDARRPMQMTVSYGSTMSVCPSLGEITMDASEALYSATSHTVVSQQSDHCSSSAPTVARQNLSGKAVHPMTAPPTVSHTHGVTKSYQLSGIRAPYRDEPLDAPLPTMARARSSDSARSAESDIFCQRKGLSFRAPPPDVNLASFAAPRKQNKPSLFGRSKATAPNLEPAESGEFVLFDLYEEQDKERQMPPIVPPFQKLFNSQKVIGSETERREYPIEDRRKNVAIPLGAKAGSSLNPYKTKAPKSTLHGKEFALSKEKALIQGPSRSKFPGKTKRNDRKFLPTPLHHEEKRIEFVFGDMDLDSCSATATSTSNTSPTSDQTAYSIEEMIASSRSPPERKLCREASSSSLDDFLNASMAHSSRGSYLGDSYCESNADCHSTEDDCDNFSLGLAMSVAQEERLLQQEEEMLMLALERSMREVSCHQDLDYDNDYDYS